MFQSLGRDSVCSSTNYPHDFPPVWYVSIPRSGFCLFKLIGAWHIQPIRAEVSIPRSGFCLFKHHRHCRRANQLPGFNPSVGILFVQALRIDNGIGGREEVSIPRSGFCLFKPEIPHHRPIARRCFNPSVGILFVQAKSAHARGTATWSFNPSVGILFVQAWSEFNSPLYYPLVSIPRSGFCLFKPGRGRRRGRVVAVSIPRSGFCLFKLRR